jgi:hypothetical protein
MPRQTPRIMRPIVSPPEHPRQRKAAARPLEAMAPPGDELEKVRLLIGGFLDSRCSPCTSAQRGGKEMQGPKGPAIGLARMIGRGRPMATKHDRCRHTAGRGTCGQWPGRPRLFGRRKAVRPVQARDTARDGESSSSSNTPSAVISADEPSRNGGRFQQRFLATLRGKGEGGRGKAEGGGRKAEGGRRKAVQFIFTPPSAFPLSPVPPAGIEPATRSLGIRVEIFENSRKCRSSQWLPQGCFIATIGKYT